MIKISTSFRKLAWLALACSLLSILLLVAGHASTQAQDPDFGNVDDPLDGDYQLFNVSDLLISRTNTQNSNTEASVDLYFLETEDEKVSSQSKVTINSPACQVDGGQVQQTRIGRFFVLPYDVIVTLGPSDAASGSKCVAGAGEPNSYLHVLDLDGTASSFVELPISSENVAFAMDDFDLDGFDDLVIINAQEIMAASAVDIMDMSKGLVVGASTAITSSDAWVMSDPATGDFNADGLKDVAWVDTNTNLNIATVCPGSVAGTICEGMDALDVLLNPQGSAFTISVTGCIPAPTSSVGLAAGKFGSFAGDGLLAISCPGGYNLHAYWYQFLQDWSLVGGEPVAELPLLKSLEHFSDTRAVAARLSLEERFDQVVFATANPQPADNCQYDFKYVEQVGVIVFDGDKMTMQFTQGSTAPCKPGFLYWAPPWLNGLAVGRFAAVPDDASTEADFDLNFATLLNNGTVRIYGVDAANGYKPFLVSETAVESSLGLTEKPTAATTISFLNMLIPGDLQGRSQRVGPPNIIRVTSHSQPSIILGAPPMHVDYILPDESTATEWQVVNFTATPYEYNSSYSMSVSGTSQSSNTDTTSYTYATTTSVDKSFQVKIPIVTVKGSIKTATENKAELVATNYAFTQNEFKYDASTTTVLGDEIWYGESAFNVYMYPLIGETSCPADNPNCTPDEEGPLYITFSGPDSVGMGPGPGPTTEWYQPIQEPGNLFSFPWTQQQLSDQITPGIDLLTDPLTFFTDDSDQTQFLNWSTSSGTSQTTGTTNTHSYETTKSLSVGGKYSKNGFGIGGSFSDSLDYSDSDAISTLNTSTSSIGASEGVAIAKPNTFLNADLYEYKVAPAIFGRVPTEGTVDEVQLTEDIQTSGPLESAFTADPLDPNAGSWWGSSESPYQQYVDVALNHPTRWVETNEKDALNCLTYDDGLSDYCLTINEPETNDLWNSAYYWMRGLLVTVGGTDGPQRTQATVGETVWLQARVYNYSFKDMEASSSIKVRFYRQEMNGTDPVGDSVLIDEKTVDPLPGFNSSNFVGVPNWTTVATSWVPPETLGDTYHIFWVLVWIEDGSGNIVAELPGHGLSGLPGELTSIGDAPLESVTLNGTDKTFSNNVGYLHMKFYIAEESSSSQHTLLSPGAQPRLVMSNAAITPQQASPYEKVIVSVDIGSSGAPSESVHARVYPDAAAWRAYAADPSLQPPRPFDVEIVPHISAGESERMEVPYQTDTCGTHELAIVANVAGAKEQVAETVKFTIPCYAYLPVFSK